MSNARENVAQLLAAFERAREHAPALVQRVGAAVKHLSDALGGVQPETLGLGGYHGFQDTLEAHLKRQGYAPQTQRTYRSAIGTLVDWGLKTGPVEARPAPAVRAAWPSGPFVCTTRQGPRRRRVPRYDRFADHMALRGRRPEDVTSEDLVAHQDELKRGRSGSKWRSEYRKLVDLCGRLADEGLLPPILFPPLPAVRGKYGIPHDRWPDRLRAEFDAYEAWHTAPVVPERPVHVHRNADSMDRARDDAGRMVGYLVRVMKIPIEAIRLVDIVDPASVAAYIQWLIDRNGGKLTATHRGFVSWAITVRRDCLHLDSSELEILMDGIRPTRRSRPEDRLTIDDLRRLAEAIRRERLAIDPDRPGIGGCPVLRQARLARDELTVRFLIARPIRSSKVCDMRLGVNLRPSGGGEWTLVFSSEETKQRRPYVCDFPQDLVPLLTEYLDVHRPVLLGERQRDYVFLSDEGNPLNTQTLWNLLRRGSSAHLGVGIRPHAFRHIVATSYLRENPGDYVTMMYLLGHASIDTTVNVYTHISQDEAGRALDALRAGMIAGGHPAA